MLSAVAALAFALQTPVLPTMAEIRKGMAEDMRRLTNYSDVWKFEVPGNADVDQFGFSRRIDGPRGILSVLIKGEAVLASGYDGKNTWVVNHPEKLYADEPAANLSFDKKGPFDPPKEAEEGSFRFTFDGPYDFEIWAKPDLKVAAIEVVKLGEVEARKVTARAERETGKMEVEMWFDRSRWRMVKARAHGGKRGEETEIIMTMTDSSSENRFTPADFGLDPSKVAGYTKKGLAELKGSGG